MNLSGDSSQLGLIGDLARLGVRGADLIDLASRIRPRQIDDSVLPSAWPEERDTVVAKRPIRVYLAEEQQVLRSTYQTFLESQDGIELLGSSDGLGAALALELEPDVVVVGVRALGEDTVDALSTLRRACPDLALVILFARYEPSGIDALKDLLSDTSAGVACLREHTVDTAAQLARTVRAVAQGRFAMDPRVMAEITEIDDAPGAPLGHLSPRELELLRLVARAIAAER